MKAFIQKMGEFFKNKYWLLRTRYQLAKDSGQLAQWKPGTKKGNLLLAGGVMGFSALAAVVFLVAKQQAPTHFEPPVTLKNLPRPKIAPPRPVEVARPAAPVAKPVTPPPAKTATKAPAKAAPSKKTAKKSTKPATKTAAKKPAAKSTARKPASSTKKKKTSTR